MTRFEVLQVDGGSVSLSAVNCQEDLQGSEVKPDVSARERREGEKLQLKDVNDRGKTAERDVAAMSCQSSCCLSLIGWSSCRGASEWTRPPICGAEGGGANNC